MKPAFFKYSGLLLIVSVILMTFTMILHPVSGGVQHLLLVSRVIIITHAIAMASMPMTMIGYWAFTKLLGQYSVTTVFAFILMCFGTASLFLAATLNGIVLPILVKDYDASGQTSLTILQSFLDYNTTLNKAFDFIYIATALPAIIFWSISILRTSIFPKALGAFGLLIAIANIVLMFSGFSVDLTGFRVFALCFIVWNLAIGYSIYRIKDPIELI